jgi:hypothetical protein
LLLRPVSWNISQGNCWPSFVAFLTPEGYLTVQGVKGRHTDPGSTARQVLWPARRTWGMSLPKFHLVQRQWPM